MKLKNADGWKCKYGCDQAFYVKSFGKGCPHLEKEIGSMRRGELRDLTKVRQEQEQVNPTPEDNLVRKQEESKTDFLEEPQPTDPEEAALFRMAKSGVTGKRAAVVLLRTVRGYTFQEIADELGYKNKDGAHHAFARAMAQIKLKETK